jgi:hypothetical protein
MSKENQEAYDTAMAELDAIEKSGKSEEDELDALTKSLEAELGEYLSKGHKEPDGDEGKDDNADDKDGKKDADDKGKDPDDMGKSQDDLFDEELVKASELYASLEKSVHEGIGSVHVELDTVKKSLAALMNLNIKQAKVIAEMVKSRQGENESIAKSLAALAGAPIAPNQAKIGIAGEQEEQIKKSVSEITELLIKSVQEGSIDARYLSLYGTHKTLECLPESVRKTIGL